MNATRTRTRRLTRLSHRERGSIGIAEIITIFAIMMLVTMLTVMTTNAVTLVTQVQAEHEAVVRVHEVLDIASTWCTRPDNEAQTRLHAILVDVVDSANAEGSGIDQNAPYLAGLELDPFDLHYQVPESLGGGPDDAADITVVTTLTAPPTSISLAGTSTSSTSPTRQDTYRWRIEYRITAYGPMGGTAYGTQLADWDISTVTTSTTTTVGVFKTADAGRADDADTTNDLAANRGTGGYTVHPVGTVVVPPGGIQPSGGWNGAPEIIDGPIAVGYDHGDRLYYWHVRGLQNGSSAGQYTSILAIDDWRFSDPTYSQTDDKIDIVNPDTHVTTRGKGSPEYAVVAVQAPSVGYTEAPNLIGRVVTATGSPMTFTAPTGWEESASNLAHPSRSLPYRVTAIPSRLEANAFPASAKILARTHHHPHSIP